MAASVLILGIYKDGDSCPALDNLLLWSTTLAVKKHSLTFKQNFSSFLLHFVPLIQPLG